MPTTKALLSPLPKVYTLLLTLSSIHIESLAQNGLVPSSQANVIDTVLYIGLWHMHRVARGEWADNIA